MSIIHFPEPWVAQRLLVVVGVAGILERPRRHFVDNVDDGNVVVVAVPELEHVALVVINNENKAFQKAGDNHTQRLMNGLQRL